MTGHNPTGLDRFTSEPTLHHPVEGLNWLEAVEVLDRLGMRLPTEAEWEHAARAGTTGRWWTGAEHESLKRTVNLSDRTARQNGATWDVEEWLEDGHTIHAPVGTYRPNPFGLHEVYGNVAELCADVFLLDYYISEPPPRRDPRARPQGQVTAETVIVVRGGSYADTLRRASSAFREQQNAEWGRPHRRVAARARHRRAVRGLVGLTREFLAQPRSREPPPSLDRALGAVDHSGDLVVLQAPEAAQLGHLGSVRVQVTEALERVVEGQGVEVTVPYLGDLVGQQHTPLLASTALGRLVGARVVDQNLAHGARGHPLEVPARLPVGARAEQLEVGLVNQRGGLQGVAPGLVAHQAVRHVVEPGVDELEGLLPGALFTLGDPVEDQGQVAVLRRHGPMFVGAADARKFSEESCRLPASVHVPGIEWGH